MLLRNILRRRGLKSVVISSHPGKSTFLSSKPHNFPTKKKKKGNND